MNFGSLKSTWIVAEIGVNHEGDYDTAAELVRLAAESGADAVKFQTYTPENYVAIDQMARRERTRKFMLNHNDFRRLSGLAKELGVIFFSTPLHPSDVDFLNDIVPIIKISSGDLTFIELIRSAASKKKPMILSTGLGTEDEIRTAVDSILDVQPEIAHKGELMLMHCVSAYPVPAEEANIANLKWLSETFGLPVGYSDHTLGIKACELAVAAGAVAIEKHFTYRKENQEFHDHLISADPDDLKALAAQIREAEVYMGQPLRTRGEAESKNMDLMRRSLGAAVDIPAGTPVRREWITWLRPAWGLSPESLDRVIGRSLVRKVAAGALIKEEDLG